MSSIWEGSLSRLLLLKIRKFLLRLTCHLQLLLRNLRGVERVGEWGGGSSGSGSGRGSGSGSSSGNSSGNGSGSGGGSGSGSGGGSGSGSGGGLGSVVWSGMAVKEE